MKNSSFSNIIIRRKFDLFFAGLVTLLLFFYLLKRIILTLLDTSPVGAYKGFFVADYMINYQGGFVRRGLIGELLFQLFRIHPFAFHEYIIYLDVIFLIFLIIISFKIFKKMSWYPILPLAINLGILCYRRDFLMIVLAFYIYKMLIKYIKYRYNKYLIISIFLTNISILIYEPCFFFIVPISMLLFWFSIDRGIKRKIIKTTYTFTTPLILMLLVCFAKGTKDTAKTIWESWQPMFDYIGPQYQPDHMPTALSFLGHDAVRVMQKHMNMNFHLTEDNFILYILGSTLMLIFCYYLTTRTIRSKKTSQKEYCIISDCYIFQMISLLPMFTVLSCDYGRTIYYIIFSSYFLSYFINSYNICWPQIKIISSFSNNIQLFLSSHSFFGNIWIYLLILFIMPFNFLGVSICHPLIIEFIPIFMPKIKLLLQICGF